jgi:predicted Zn-dependent protease
MSRFWHLPLLLLLLLLACAALCAGGCASSPKSGEGEKKKRTVLMTEYDDARVGQEVAVDVAAQMGILDDPALNAYVTEIGLKLLRGVGPRQYQYHFAVVDQEEPNAFALPGGYVFISRGLLALANSEDELACVIGHEITHVQHRHAAAQQGLAGRGLTMPWVKAGRMAAYGRDMERDADEGGQILCAAAGYDPLGMSTFLANLEQTERGRVGYSRNPGFLATHPGSTERASVNAVRASELRWRRDPSLGDTKKSLLAKIEGLPLGQRPQAGVFEGDVFLHPDLDFTVRFPHAWQTANSNQAVGAAEPRGQAIVFVTADAPKGEPRQIAEAWAKKTGEEQRLDVRDSRPVKIGHIDAWRMQVEVPSGGVNLASLITFIPYRDATWRITGMTRASQAEDFLGRTLATMRSFRPLTAEERASITETTLHVTTAQQGDTLERLGERTGNAWPLQTTALMNGLFYDNRFAGGELVKIARTRKYVSPPPQSSAPAP